MTGLPAVTDRDAADDRGWFAANPGRRYRIRETVGAWWVIRRRGEEVLLRAILLSPLTPVLTARRHNQVALVGHGMAAADARAADQERPVPERSDITALDPLAQEARFVAWRIELRGDKPTKVPYSPHGGKAKADDPSTWGTRAEAEAKAAKIVNGLGGLGLELGDLGDGTYVAGVDLDSCITDGNLANWAKLILAALPTYAEVSPSGQGIKAFFYLAAKDVHPFLELVGITYPKQWGLKRAIGEDARDHGPAVEVYFAGRFFAVTGDRWVAQPDTINMLDWPTLEGLARLIPPTRSGTDEADKRGADNSRSAIAFRKGAALRRAGKSCDEMVAALRTDPETADWVRNKGDANGGRELRRIWDRAAPDDVPDYTIRVTGGLRHQAADKGLAAMLAAGVEFYQRDRMLVRVCCIEAKASDGRIVAVPAIVLVTTAMLGRALGQSARWEKVNSKGELIRIDPPKEVVEQIAGMTGEWPFPPLTGVIGTPTLRPDGSLLTREGYDSATGLALLSPPPMPRIPDEPTWDDAEAALTLLNELLAEFPFANDASRSVAMSMLITPILRGALPPAVPLHIVTAPEAGTGKSYLADIASAIAVGDRCAALAIAPRPEETEKRLIGAALAGLPIISLDNVSDFLFGDFLCQATERPVLQIRPLAPAS